MSDSLIGRTLGNYEVLELLGYGGMATVYIGYQEAVDRRVAIKVLPPHPGMDKQFIDRFQLEARTIAKLQHPHILPLYDYGMTDDNILYLAMAYITGGTLGDLIDSGPMPINVIEKILRDIAAALDYAHRQGVVHRDLKPANILMDAEGHALLADFGIVKLSEGGANLTGTAVVGTPAYMAPEQAQGIEIDQRADIYALGTIVFEMLSGQQPFQADTPMQLLLQVIQEEPADILELREDLPPALDLVIRRAMAKAPAERYQSAIEFAEDFSNAVHNNEDSLLFARRAMPLGQSKQDDTMTVGKDGSTREMPPLTQANQPASTQLGTGGENQTIIVQNQTNPLLLLGGFALIAIIVVAVVLVALDRGGNNPPPRNENDEEASLTQTADAEVVVDTPTESPTDIPEVTFGRVNFATFNALGDTVNLRSQNLQALPTGQVYGTWLINTATDEVLQIGEFSVDALGEGSLSYTDEDGRLLPAFFNAVMISVEESADMGDQPTGEIVYSGLVPIEVTELYFSTFVEAENGINGGSLLAGARAEAGTAENHAGLAARASNIPGVQTHAEHTINILRGEEEDHDGNGRPSNPGAGVGIYFFLDEIEAGLDLAIQSPFSTRNFAINAESLRICLFNTRERADRIIELELELTAAEEDPNAEDGGLSNLEPTLLESTVIAEALIPGIDLNQNEIVEDFEGECGLDQIETFGLLAAQLDLTEGDFSETTDTDE